MVSVVLNSGMRKVVSELKLKVLYKISSIIHYALDLDQALKNVLEILSESLAMKRATITLKDMETGNLLVRASYGLNMEEEQRGIYHLDEGVTGLIFTTREPFVVRDIRKRPHLLKKIGSRRIDRGQIAFIGVPIVLLGCPIGVLSVDRLFGDDVSFEEDVQFLSLVALLIAPVGQSSAPLEEQRSVKRMAPEPQPSFFPAGKQLDTEDYSSCLKSSLEKIEKREYYKPWNATIGFSPRLPWNWGFRSGKSATGSSNLVWIRWSRSAGIQGWWNKVFGATKIGRL